MSDSTNAHVELPSQSNSNYDSNVVCCTSSSSNIGNSCSALNYQVFARAYDVTNSHIQDESINTYGNNLCLSSDVGDMITVGHQNTNCSGYDTTIASISASDNAHAGDSSAYTEKLCAKVVPPLLTLSISANSVSLGTITTSTTGSGSHTISATTNASGGFAISYNGPTLTNQSNNSYTIPVYTAGSSSAGTAGFGINLKANTTPSVGADPTTNSGTCGVASAYNTANTFEFKDSTTTTITNVTAPADCVYTVSYVGNISNTTAAGSYSTNITYVLSGTF